MGSGCFTFNLDQFCEEGCRAVGRHYAQEYGSQDLIILKVEVGFWQSHQVLDDSNKPFYKWFVGAKTNIVHNAIDRHLTTSKRNKIAFIWEGEPGDFSKKIMTCFSFSEEKKSNYSELLRDIVLKNHAEDQRWCLDCHNPDNRDKLRLASGQVIFFEKSYLLCGQCHGTIYRDWKAGVHGKRTGHWNGRKQYRLCVHCHNPHQPKFKPLKPLPPPIRPEDIKYIKSPADEIPLNPLNSLLKPESKHAKEN